MCGILQLGMGMAKICMKIQDPKVFSAAPESLSSSLSSLAQLPQLRSLVLRQFLYLYCRHGWLFGGALTATTEFAVTAYYLANSALEQGHELEEN